MPVPSLVTDLSTTQASNYPAGSDNVFPSLDDTLRALSAFIASIRDNSGNGWVSPYLPLAGGTVSGPATFSSTVALNGALSGTGLTTYLASPPAIGGTAPAAVSSTNLSYTGTLTGGTGVVNLGSGQFYKDASGNINFGSATRDSTGLVNAGVQIQGLTGIAGSLGQYSWNANTTSHPYQTFNKSMGAAVGTRGAVADGQTLGITYWAGDDGTNFIRAASLTAAVDGTPGTNDMPGRLVFSTTADGASSPTERMRIDSAGLTTLTGTAIISANTGTDALRITQTGGGNALLVEDSANPDATPFVIDASGKAVIGYTAPILSLGITPTAQVIGAGLSSSTYLAACFANDATSSGALYLNKSRGAIGTIGTIVQSGDTLGSIQFLGDDGAAMIRGAAITSQVDGTPGLNDMPGRLIFSTTADGGSSPGERMRIDSNGNVGIANATPTVRLLVDRLQNSPQPPSYTTGTTAVFIGATAAGSPSYVNIVSGNAAAGAIFFGDTDADSRGRVQYDHATDSMALWTSNGEKVRIDSSGNVGIGTAPSVNLDVSSAGNTIARIASTFSGSTTTGLAIDTVGDTSAARINVSKSGVSRGLLRFNHNATAANEYWEFNVSGAQTYQSGYSTHIWSTNAAEKMRLDAAGNVQVRSGAVVVYAPAPASISTTATLTNANIQAQIINTTGTSYTVTMPLGTTLETLVTWAGTDLGYDFTVINTASGTITMAANTGVTTLGSLTIATGTSAQFRIRRTAANTFVMYRLS